jgi:hypothetical protein
LRSRGAQLTEDDHDELLAAAGDSLDQLTHLLASLPDASRPDGTVEPEATARQRC